MSDETQREKLLKFARLPLAGGSVVLLVAVTVEVALASGNQQHGTYSMIARVLVYLGLVGWSTLVLLETLRRQLQQVENRIAGRVADAEGRLGAAVRTGLLTPLHSADALYRTLCEARARSKHVRLMKIREEPPIQVDGASSLCHDALGPHAAAWYDCLAEWAKQDGNRAERVFAVGDALARSTRAEREPLIAYAGAVEREMRRAGVDAASWEQILVLWPFAYPAANVCFFDDREAVLTIGTGSGEKFPVSGIHIAHPPTVRLLLLAYYEPLRRRRHLLTERPFSKSTPPPLSLVG